MRAMNTKKKPSRQEGFVLLTSALVVALLLIGIGTTLFIRDTSEAMVEYRSNANRVALQIAENALNESATRFAAGLDPDMGSEQSPIDSGPGAFWVESRLLDATTVSIVATAQTHGDPVLLERIIRSGTSASQVIGPYGIFARDYLLIRDNGTIDSYDADVGYNPADASDASVGANADITLTGGSTVHGTVSSTGTVMMSNGASVSGTVEQGAAEFTVPDLPEPPVGTSSGSYHVPWGNASLPPDTYHFDSLELQGGSRVTIEGPATVVVDDMWVAGGSQLTLDTSNGPVTFHVGGQFKIDNGTQVKNSSGDPEDARFFISTNNSVTGESVVYGGGAIFEGFLFAPNSDLTVANNTNFFGAIVAKSLTLAGGSRLHHDVTLSELQEGGGQVATEGLLWRQLSESEKEALDNGTHAVDDREAVQ